MATLRGWAPCGTRLTAKVPHGHWKTTTFLAALRCDRIEAPWVLDGPIDGESFAIYVEKVLLPTLQPGDIVIMDNLGCACRKLNPGILVMQPAQDWATKNVPGAIDGAREGCILLQG
jgi:hypothetical protein